MDFSYREVLDIKASGVVTTRRILKERFQRCPCVYRGTQDCRCHKACIYCYAQPKD